MEPEPPWARFPDYEHLCLGWRMGSGESWLGIWWAHLKDVPLSEREAYLRRHPPAPHTWYEAVWRVLGVDEAPEADGLQQLITRKLVASDIAYPTWKREVTWPWELGSEGLLDTVRYETRTFSFLGRALSEDRSQRALTPVVPAEWKAVEQALTTGSPGPLRSNRGLETLGVLFCAGAVVGPWTLGCEVSDFEDRFDHEMNYVDAFRLWLMSVFDDVPHYERECARLAPPEDWRRWMDSEVFLPADEE